MAFGKRQLAVAEAAPFDINKLEEEIRLTMPPKDDETVSSYAPKLPMPSYVEHVDGVDDVGRLSAEAIVQQYENAAKQVEEMGNDIKNSAAKLTAALAEHDADMKMIAETAQAIRDRGKEIFLRIENASHITTELRATCAELRKKIS